MTDSTSNDSFTTDREIGALKPAKKRYKVTDKTRRGLYIEVNPTGVKAWHYRYTFNGKQERIALGHYPAVKLTDARQLRDAAALMVSQGVCPRQQKQQQQKAAELGLTVQEYGERYYSNVVCKDRANPKPMRLILDNDIFPMIGNKRMAEISKEDVREVIWRKKEQGYDAAAYQVRGLLKRMFDYAVTEDVITHNPVRAIPSRHVFKYVEGDRALSPDEIRKFYTALLDSRIYRSRKLGLLLSLLTLVRKSEMLNTKWEHIDFEKRIWHIPVTKNTTGGKNSRPMMVFMSTQIMDIFRELQTIAGDEPYVFCGRKKGTRLAHNVLNTAQKNALALTDIPSFTIHDLRRTASTLMNEKGFHADAIEACLNHTIKGMRGVYNKAVYADIREVMMQEWSDYVYSIIYEKNLIFFNANLVNVG